MLRKQIGVQATPGATLAAATILSLPLGSIYAFSVLLAPLEQLLHASRADLVSVFGVSAVFFTIGANLGPLLFGRHPARLSRPRLVGSSSATGCCSRLAAAWLTSAAVRECCAARPVWPRQWLSRQSISPWRHAGSHPPMVWGLIGSECVKRLPPWRPWSPQRHLRRPCCSRGGSGKAPDCFGTDGRPRQPAGHLLVWNIPRKSLESRRDRFLGLEHASACSARDCGFPCTGRHPNKIALKRLKECPFVPTFRVRVRTICSRLVPVARSRPPLGVSVRQPLCSARLPSCFGVPLCS